MLFTYNFLRYFIGTFLTLLLMINVIYAFNLTSSLGLPYEYINLTSNYSDKYFGVSTLINSFTGYFTNNQSILRFQGILKFWYDSMGRISFNQLFSFVENWGVSVSSSNGAIANLMSIVTIAFGILNVLVNLPYVLMLIIYLLLFLVYVLMIIFLGISYACYLFSGVAYSFLPNTTYPNADDIINGTYTFIRCMLVC